MQPLLPMEQIPNVQIGLISEIEIDDNADVNNNKPLPFTLLYYVQKTFDMIGIPNSRTQQCKHKGSCICSALSSSTKAGVMSYGIKACLSAVFALKKIFKNPKQVLGSFFTKDSLKFGCFVGLFLLIFRGLVCILRRQLSPEKQKYIFLIGGLIAGTAAAFVLEKKSRQTFGLFLMARAIDITYRSLVEKKIIPQIKYFYPLLYSIMMIVTGGIALGSEPAAMSSDLHPFYLLFTSQTAQDQQMRQIWIARKNNELLKRGIPAYDPLDYLPKAKALNLKK